MTRSTAPTYKELRPLKDTRTSTFPVYPDLAERLLATDTHPSPKIAHALAACAGYAYGDADTVSMMMARLGLEKNNTLMISELVDAMFICATAFLVQSCDGKVVILSFRGTEPTSLINWLMVADISPAKVPIRFPGPDATYLMHGGFYRNVRAIRYQIVNALLRAMNGHSVITTEDEAPSTEPGPLRPLEALYITGHSLGGAMAAITAIMLVNEPRYIPILGHLRAIYTYGQPMIGNRDLAMACDADPDLVAKMIRYVNGRDVVPQVPPKDTGDFAHFGREYTNSTDGASDWHPSARATRQLPNLLYVAQAPLAFIARQLPMYRKRKFRASLYDHFPEHYISALTPLGIRTEFGD